MLRRIVTYLRGRWLESHLTHDCSWQIDWKESVGSRTSVSVESSLSTLSTSFDSSLIVLLILSLIGERMPLLCDCGRPLDVRFCMIGGLTAVSRVN